MAETNEHLACARETAIEAGRCIVALRESGRYETHTKHGGRELVTSADLASDALIRGALRTHTPDAQILSEEVEAVATDWRRPVWVIDPIDGTVNYAYGHDHVAVSIAYVVDGRVQVGVVHAPFRGQTFTAVRGQGAHLNGVALAPVPGRPLAEALIASGFPHGRDGLAPIVRRLGRVRAQCRDVRRLACPALEICFVAAGRLDAAYETLAPWDVAAAGLVAQEAGVARGHYGPPTSTLPDELRGEDVAFARPPLLDALLATLRDDAEPLAALATQFEAASSRYAEAHAIERDDDWYLLKLQEELGELTQAWIRLSGRGRATGLTERELSERLADEAADVLGHVLLFAHRHRLDLASAIRRKWRFSP